MACDFTVAADSARFGQAGPRHGSAPDGGSTDFLPLYVGFSYAMASCVLCEMWSAHKAAFLGLINEVVPVYKVDGKYVPNPMIVTDRFADDFGRIVYTLVDVSLLSTQPGDREEDFDQVFDFRTALDDSYALGWVPEA